jgi:hypothetical protein
VDGTDHFAISMDGKNLAEHYKAVKEQLEQERDDALKGE